VTRSYSFAVESALRAPADRVWAHASTFAGVNRELWPLVRMTYPPQMARLTPEAVPLGRTAFRSWILLFGLVPVDYDDIALRALDPGRGFDEASRLFSATFWGHRRTITPAGAGCVVRDELTIEPRWAWAGPVLVRVYRLAFALRHRNLRRMFGPNPPPPLRS
jgi:ligand-binding SRPBCC domain-containing protein